MRLEAILGKPMFFFFFLEVILGKIVEKHSPTTIEN